MTLKAPEVAPQLLDTFLNTVDRRGLTPVHCKAFKWAVALPVRLTLAPQLLETFLTTVDRRGLTPVPCKAIKWPVGLPLTRL